MTVPPQDLHQVEQALALGHAANLTQTLPKTGSASSNS
jgi:hypothetical protein